MIKQFCDICLKETSFEESVRISAGPSIRNATYCFDCFQNPKHWKTIHEVAQKKKPATIASS